MAFLTLSASSFDINRPAFTTGASLGSSVVMAVLVDFVDAVVEIVVARAVGRLSAVRNSDLALCLSCDL